jgi:hypothetical protein
MSRFEGSVQEQKAPACRRRTWYAGRPAWACRAAGTINAGRGAPAAGQPHLTPLLLRVPQAPPPTLPRAGPSSSLPPHLSLFLSSLARSRSLPQSLSSPPPPPTLTLSSPASLSLRLLLSPPSPSSGRPKADAADCSTSAPARAARPPPPQQQQQQQQQAPPQQQQQQQQLAAGGGSPRLRPGNHRLGPAGALGGGVSSRPI